MRACECQDENDNPAVRVAQDMENEVLRNIFK